MTNSIERIRNTRRRRSFRVRNSVARKSHDQFSVRVFRSSKHMYVDLYDLTERRVLAGLSSANTVDRAVVGSGVNVAMHLGKAMSERILALGISKVTFDRSGYRFHGRVAALAAGLRDGGCIF